MQRPISKFSNLLIDFFSRQIRGPLAQLDQLFFDALVDNLGRTILHVLLSFSNNILHLKHLFGELLVSILVAQLLIFHGFAAHLAVVSTGLLLIHVHHALSVHNRVEVLEVELLYILEGILHYPDGVDKWQRNVIPCLEFDLGLHLVDKGQLGVGAFHQTRFQMWHHFFNKRPASIAQS